MFAIFKTGSKQYQVKVNDVIYTEKLEGKVGDKINFTQVMMIDNAVGRPYLNNAKVVCEIEKQGKQRKINIIKFRSQKHHMKRQGHRQPYTRLKVLEIIK